MSAQRPPLDARPWAPARHARRRPALIARGRMIAAIRSWFAAADFIEVETPILQVSPGLEPHLMAFATAIEDPDGTRRDLYLHTSPEFAMKKLLAAGEPRIFQLARVFRNGERAALHHPEFTMLEWYRAGASYQDLITDCEGLIRAAAQATGTDRLRFNGREARLDGPFERLSVAEAFTRHAGIDLGAVAQTPAFQDAARAIGVRIAEDDDWDAVFFKVFLDRIEPRLGHPAPCALVDYPIHMAALARARPDAPHLAERFEIYVCGVELANAFGELTDPEEQARRFAADMDLKQRLYGLRYPIDADFLDALGTMPEAAGIALGIDRLAMLCLGAARIEDVLWLPVA